MQSLRRLWLPVIGSLLWAGTSQARFVCDDIFHPVTGTFASVEI
jgi:hypothetical protein